LLGVPMPPHRSWFGSARGDVRQIYRTGTDEDSELIRDLAARLGLESLLDEVLSESDEVRD
jgi:hypothetical protein